MKLDIERLRYDLKDYFGSLMMIYPSAVIELSRIDNMSETEVIALAVQNGFPLNNYEVVSLGR